MGEIIDFEISKSRLIKKYQRYYQSESNLKRTLMNLKLYVQKEQMSLIEKETNMFIDFLLEKLYDSSNYINDTSSIAIELRNITKIKYDFIDEVDVLLWVGNFRHISLSGLRSFFGESFSAFFVETENEYYHEETDSDYSTINYLFTVVGPIDKVKELNKFRFQKNKEKLYKK